MPMATASKTRFMIFSRLASFPSKWKQHREVFEATSDKSEYIDARQR
jgi:hypothetical protein